MAEALAWAAQLIEFGGAPITPAMTSSRARPAGIAIAHARNNVARTGNNLQLSPIRQGAGRRPNMRVMETLTGSVLSAATIVLAVGAIFAL